MPFHFGRNDRTRADSLKQGAHTFDFLGFTHYWGKSRRGYPVLYRKTSSKRFRRACKELAAWLKTVRSSAKVQEWWPILQAKLRGHYQYYGISGNGRSLVQYADLADHLVFKWLNRRSQKVSFNWKGFRAYLEHYPLPKPRIVHSFYTPSVRSVRPAEEPDAGNLHVRFCEGR